MHTHVQPMNDYIMQLLADLKGAKDNNNRGLEYPVSTIDG